MSENNEFTLISDDGEGSENKTSVNPAEGSKPEEGNAVNEGSENATGEGKQAAQSDKSDVTGSFKERLDRMRRKEREKTEAAIRDNDAKWEKKFKELEDRFNASQKPQALKREDFSSDEDFVNAKRQKAMEELMDAMEKRNADKESKAAEEKAKQDEADAYKRKFAERFNEGMRKNLNEQQQKQVLSIVNDEYSAVNQALTSKGGEVLQKWIMEDCDNPADVLLFLENSGKLDRLLELSERKQIAQLDMLERNLAKSRYEASKKGSEGGETNPNPVKARNVPVMGQFGGSTQAVGDDSQLSDQERVAKLIKAMRKR